MSTGGSVANAVKPKKQQMGISVNRAGALYTDIDVHHGNGLLYHGLVKKYNNSRVSAWPRPP